MNDGRLKSLVNGKKTYLIAIGSLIALFVGWADNQIATGQLVEQSIALVLAITIRHGVSKSKVFPETEQAVENPIEVLDRPLKSRIILR